MRLKLPICYFDAKTKILCPLCRDKLNRGEISELDVDVSHDLIKIEEREIPQLKDAEFIKAIRADNITLILVRSGAKVTRTIWNRVARQLSKRGYGRVKIVEYTNDVKNLIQNIIFPARVLSMSIVWFPDGTSEHYVRVSSRDLKRMPLSPKTVEGIVEKLTGIKVKIALEKF